MNYVDFAKPILCDVYDENSDDIHQALIVKIEEEIEGRSRYIDTNDGIWVHAEPVQMKKIENNIDSDLFYDYKQKMAELNSLRRQNSFSKRIE